MQDLCKKDRKDEIEVKKEKEVKQETSENKKGRPEISVCLFVSIHKNIKKLYAFFIVLKTEIYLEIWIPLVRIFVAS